MATSSAISSQPITIDLLFLILSRSVFHPFVAGLIPVCLLAASFPTNHPHVVWTTYYAILVSIVALLQTVDNRLAYGKARSVNWEDEVVVITGGASGLGRILVEMYGRRGVSVAVLDVNIPSKQELLDDEILDSENVRWYKCDVSSQQAVQQASEHIQHDLGPPTILINNAGIMHGLPLLSLTSSQVASTIAINLQSHFNTLQTFLPSILASPTGGTIVTVSSVLGHLGASHLSDYAASKAGLLALHASLVAELKSTYSSQGGDRVRTILVAPGQLATRLFGGLETPSPFLGPIVEPVELAREIVRKVDAGVSGEITLPLYARFIGIMAILPPGLRALARWSSGVDRAMAGMREEKPASQTKVE